MIDYSADAEIWLLGHCLASPNGDIPAFRLVCDRVATTHFAKADHSAVYAAVCALAEDGQPLNPATAMAQLRKDHPDADRRFGTLISDLVNHGSPRRPDRDLVSWAKLIRQAARDRAARALGQQLQAELEGGDDPQATMARAQDRMTELRAEQSRDEEETDELTHAVAELERLIQGGADATKLPTGFVDVDRALDIRPSTLTVIAGTTSAGKTALALNVGEDMARDGRSVLFVSLEMSESELHRRRLLSETGLPMAVFKRWEQAPTDWQHRLSQAWAELKARPLRIVDGSHTASEVRAIARAHQARHGLELIVVDYLQILRPDRATPSREREVASMVESLKHMAMELNCAVLAPSQLNREASSANSSPQLHQLRESGAIEQTADNVLLLYRSKSDPPNVVTLRIGKQRNGRLASVRLRFEGALFRFENYTPMTGLT